MDSQLYVGHRQVQTVFGLLGRNEDDMTASVGWALHTSPAFREHFLHRILGAVPNAEDVTVRLQHRERDRGITDIEVVAEGVFHLIIEAKRGWHLPSKAQLLTYGNRSDFLEHTGVRKVVVLTACRHEYASAHLPITKIGSIDIVPLAWTKVVTIADEAKKNGGRAEARLIGQLVQYLKGLVTMRDVQSNMVYVVPINTGTNEGWGISWIDIVEKKKRYFHPIGNRYPQEPVNYIGFRYRGRLQSVHHVEDFVVTRDLHQQFSEIPSKQRSPMFVYELGPKIGPAREVRTGGLYGPGRHLCMLDTLLTCETVKEARDETKRRLAEAGIE